MIIITTIIIRTPLKGAIRVCLFVFLHSPYCAVSQARALEWTLRNRAQNTYNTSGAFHVQLVVCHEIGRDRSAIKSDRAKISFNQALFYCLKPMADEVGEETGVSREDPDHDLQKMPHTKAREFKPQLRLEPAL